MNSCDAYEPLLAGALFGDLSREEHARLKAHLSECDACAQALRELRATLDTMAVRERPAPPAGFWDTFGEQLEARLEARERDASEAAAVRPRGEVQEGGAGAPRSASPESGAGLGGQAALEALAHRLGRVPAGVRYGALALCSLVLGLLIGRTVLAPSATGPVPRSVRMQEQQGDPAVSRRARLHLARSKVLLIEIAEFEPDTDEVEQLRLADKKRTARSLVRESETLQAALSDPRQKRLRSLLAELRDLLRQIVALKGTRDVEGVEVVQGHLRDSDLVLRINLEELRLASLLPVATYTASR